MNILSPIIARDAGSNLMGRLAVFSRLTGTGAFPLIQPLGTLTLGAASNPTYRPTTLGIVANEHSNATGMDEQGHWFHTPTLTLGLREYGGVSVLPNQMSNLQAEWNLRGGTSTVTCDRTFNANGTGGVMMTIADLDTLPFQPITNVSVPHAKARFKGFAQVAFISANSSVPTAVVTLTQNAGPGTMWLSPTGNNLFVAYLNASFYNSTTLANIKITLTVTDGVTPTTIVIADQPFAATEGIWRSAPFRFSAALYPSKVEWVFTLNNGSVSAQTPPSNGMRLYEAGIASSLNVPMFGLAALRGYNTYAEDNIFQKTVQALDLVTTRIPNAPYLSTDTTGKIVPATTAGVDQITNYVWSVTTTGPGIPATYLRFDSATVASVTNLFVADLNAQSVDMSPTLSKLTGGDYIAVQHKTDATKTYRFRMRGPSVDNTTYWTLPVEYISSDNALLPANNDLVTFIGSKTGQGSGTINTVAKWTSPTTLGNSTIIDNGSTVSTTLKFIAPNLDGTVGRVARWVTDTNTFGDSLFQDDGVNIGLNQAPAADVALGITRTFPTLSGTLQYGILLAMNVSGPSTGGKYGMRNNMVSTGSLTSLNAFFDYVNVGGVINAGVGTQGTIDIVNSFLSAPRIGDGATITDRVGFSANAVLPISNHFGYGTIVNNIGFNCEPLGLGTNSNIGYRAQLIKGANHWNFYAVGTADNYFAGSVGIGKQVPTVELDVVGSSRVTADTYLGTAVWGAASLATDGAGKVIPGVSNPVGGTGDDDYLARWMPPSGATLGIGATRDNGTNVGINTAPVGNTTLTLSRNAADGANNEFGVYSYLNANVASTLDRKNFVSHQNIVTTSKLTSVFGWHDYAYSAVNADITTLYGAYLSGNFTAASKIGDRYGLYVGGLTNSATVITTHTGIIIQPLTAIGTVFGLRSQIAAGASKFNIYAEGTAGNYFAGIVGIGSAVATDTQLRVHRVPVSAGAVDLTLYTSLTNSVDTTFDRRSIFNSLIFTQPGSSGNGFGFYDYVQQSAGIVPQYATVTASGALTGGTMNVRFGVFVQNPGNSHLYIRDNTGLHVQDMNAIAATGFVRGLWSAINSSSYAKHNLYLSGNAPNYILGNVGIGAGKTAPAQALDAVGSVQVTQSFISTAVAQPGFKLLQLGPAFVTSTGLSHINQGLRINGGLAVHDTADLTDPSRHALFVASGSGLDLTFPASTPAIAKVFGSTGVSYLKTTHTDASTAIIALYRQSSDTNYGLNNTEKWYKIAFIKAASTSFGGYGNQLYIEFWGGVHPSDNKAHYKITFQNRNSANAGPNAKITFHSLGVFQTTYAGIRIYEDSVTKDTSVYAFMTAGSYPNFLLNAFASDLLNAASPSTTLYPDPASETDPASASLIKIFDTATATPLFAINGYQNSAGVLTVSAAKIGTNFIAAGNGGVGYIPKWSTTTGTLVDSPILDNLSTVYITGRNFIVQSSSYFLLKAAPAGNAAMYMDVDIGQTAGFMFRKGASSNRWYFWVDSAAESGANAGSNFQCYAYADDGVTPKTVYIMNRATANVAFTEAVTAKNLYISSLTAGAPYVAIEAGTGRLVGTTAPGGGGAVSGTMDTIAKFGPTGATVINSRFRESGSNAVLDGTFYVQNTTTPAQQGAMNIIVAAGQFAQFAMFRGDAANSANKPRWAWIMDNGSESHASAGFSATSAMYFRRYADDGVAYGDIFVVNRSNGKLDFKVTPSVNGVDVSTGGNISATVGTTQKLLKFTNSLAPFTVANSLLTEGTDFITLQGAANATFQIFSTGASTIATLQMGNSNEWKFSRDTDGGFALYRTANATPLWKVTAAGNVVDFKYTPSVNGVDILLSNVATGPGTGSQNNVPKWSATNTLTGSTITDGANTNELEFYSLMVRAKSISTVADQVFGVSSHVTRRSDIQWQSNLLATGAASSVKHWSLQREPVTSGLISGGLRGGADLVLLSYDDSGNVPKEVLRFSRNTSGLVTFQGTANFTQLVSFTNFTITSSAMIASLNANFLNGKLDSAFALASHSHPEYQAADAGLTSISTQAGLGYLRQTATDVWITDTQIPWTSISGEPALTNATGTAGAIPMFDNTLGLASSTLSQSSGSIIYQSLSNASFDIRATGAGLASARFGSEGGIQWRFQRESSGSFSFYRQGSGTPIWESVPGTDNFNFKVTPTVNGNAIWHAGNDGSGFGLDADKLDGIEGGPTGGYSLTSHNHDTLYQPKNDNLSQIVTLSAGGALGVLRKTAPNTWGLDASVGTGFYKRFEITFSMPAMTAGDRPIVDILAASLGSYTPATGDTVLLTAATSGTTFTWVGPQVFNVVAVASPAKLSCMFWAISDSALTPSFKAMMTVIRATSTAVVARGKVRVTSIKGLWRYQDIFAQSIGDTELYNKLGGYVAAMGDTILISAAPTEADELTLSPDGISAMNAVVIGPGQGIQVVIVAANPDAYVDFGGGGGPPMMMALMVTIIRIAIP